MKSHRLRECEDVDIIEGNWKIKLNSSVVRNITQAQAVLEMEVNVGRLS